MTVHHLADMTWEEVRDVDRARTVAILPVGAVEAHGPHLPLGTDVLIAEAMARACAERLDARGLPALLLPPLWYGPAPFARAFPGTMHVEPDAVTSLVGGLARSLGEHGVPVLAVANAHLDPAHLRALREAAAGPAGGARIAFLDLTRRAVAERLTEEFRTGACHAGRFEGSMVLAERPDLFRASVAASLEPNPASLSVAIREGKRTFEEAGGRRAYFGWPAEASSEEGRGTLQTLGALLAELALEALAERA